MNNIRHAYETKLIQSDEYKNLTNAEREKLHLKLFHTGYTAFANYNKVNKKKEDEIFFLKEKEGQRELVICDSSILLSSSSS